MGLRPMPKNIGSRKAARHGRILGRRRRRLSGSPDCHIDAEGFCDCWRRRTGDEYTSLLKRDGNTLRVAKRGGEISVGQRLPRRQEGQPRRSAFPLFLGLTAQTRNGYARVTPAGAFEPNRFLAVRHDWQCGAAMFRYYDPKAYGEGASKETVDPAGPRTGKKKVVREGKLGFWEQALPGMPFGLGSSLISARIFRDSESLRVPTPRDENPERATAGSVPGQ